MEGSEKKIDVALVIVGGVFVVVPMILGSSVSSLPDYQKGIFVDDVWYYGMIGLGLIAITWGIIIDKGR